MAYKTFEFDRMVIENVKFLPLRFCFVETAGENDTPIAPLFVYSYDDKALVEFDTLCEDTQNLAWNFAYDMYHSYLLDQYDSELPI